MLNELGFTIVLANSDELPDAAKAVLLIAFVGFWIWLVFRPKKEDVKKAVQSTSIKQSARNIYNLLNELILQIVEVQSKYLETGQQDEAGSDKIHKLQKDLLFELNGPIPVSIVKEHIIEPMLDHYDAHESTRVSVNHVLDSYYKNANESSERKTLEMFGELSEEILSQIRPPKD